MKQKELLADIDKIEWNKLTHAYGEASDVPAVIRKLLSDDSEERNQALWVLYGNIFHQGTRYQATPYAVPFIYELIAAPEVKDRDQLIYLLVKIALGYEEAFLPTGIDIEKFRQSREDAMKQMSDEDKSDCEEYGFGPDVELDCYDAVKKGIPELIALLDSEDEAVQNAAAYALAWFPEEADTSLPAIRSIIRKHKNNLYRANALLAFGLLARSSGAQVEAEDFEFELTHESLLLRTAAAITLYKFPLPDKLVNILIEAIQESSQLQGLEEIQFNEGNLSGYASCVLTCSDESAYSKVIPALCKTLENVNAYQSLDITSSILQMVVLGKEKYLRDIPVAELKPLEVDALRAIANHGGWKIDDATFVNYSDLVGSFGCPDSQEALLAYLDDK